MKSKAPRKRGLEFSASDLPRSAEKLARAATKVAIGATNLTLQLRQVLQEEREAAKFRYDWRPSEAPDVFHCPAKLPKVLGVPGEEFRRAITNNATIHSLREFQTYAPLALRDKPEALFHLLCETMALQPSGRGLAPTSVLDVLMRFWAPQSGWDQDSHRYVNTFLSKSVLRTAPLLDHEGPPLALRRFLEIYNSAGEASDAVAAPPHENLRCLLIFAVSYQPRRLAEEDRYELIDTVAGLLVRDIAPEEKHLSEAFLAKILGCLARDSDQTAHHLVDWASCLGVTYQLSERLYRVLHPELCSKHPLVGALARGLLGLKPDSGPAGLVEAGLCLYNDTKRLVTRGGDCVPLVARERALIVLTVLALERHYVTKGAVEGDAARAALVALHAHAVNLCAAVPGRLERGAEGLMNLKNHAVSLECLLRWRSAHNPSPLAPGLAVREHYNSLPGSRDGLSAAEQAKERAENPFLSIGLPSTLKMASSKGLK